MEAHTETGFQTQYFSENDSELVKNQALIFENFYSGFSEEELKLFGEKGRQLVEIYNLGGEEQSKAMAAFMINAELDRGGSISSDTKTKKLKLNTVATN